MHVAKSHVTTDKAQRYLKALCNHFNRKVTAEYTDNHGTVQFGIGFCEMNATDDALVIRIQAEDEEKLSQVKYVVADHLERFSGEDRLQVQWLDEA